MLLLDIYDSIDVQRTCSLVITPEPDFRYTQMYTERHFCVRQTRIVAETRVHPRSRKYAANCSFTHLGNANHSYAVTRMSMSEQVCAVLYTCFWMHAGSINTIIVWLTQFLLTLTYHWCNLHWLLLALTQLRCNLHTLLLLLTQA